MSAKPSIQRETGIHVKPPAYPRKPRTSGCRPRATAGRDSWSFSRFASTVLFFNDPIGGLLARVAPSAGQTEKAGQNVVVVTGATGGVGRNVVANLLATGRKVRAIVRNPEKARLLLADLPRDAQSSLEIVEADVTQPHTLTPTFFSGACSLISATATIVGPKEGDTNDRQKYRQGIKFYEPEVKGQSPEEVEYNGMKNILQAAKTSLQASTTIFHPFQDGLQRWGALDDVVMGGVSSSSFRRSESGSHAVFSGRVSANNNGGFASVRTKNFSPPLDLSSCNALRLQVRGDGLRYKVSLRTDTNWDGIGYTQSFDTQKDEWQNIDLPFENFMPVFRAKSKPDAPSFDASRVTSIQLMLSKFEYDGKLNPRFCLGDFSLPVAKIEGISSDKAVPKIVHISSCGVTRLGNPELDLEKEPPAVRMNDALGRLLTWKLAAEDLLRQSGIPYVIVRPVALTDEPAGADLEVGQGDYFKGKISRADVAELCIALLSETVATNTTIEVKSKVNPVELQTENKTLSCRWRDLLTKAHLKPDPSGEFY